MVVPRILKIKLNKKIKNKQKLKEVLGSKSYFFLKMISIRVLFRNMDIYFLCLYYMYLTFKP